MGVEHLLPCQVEPSADFKTTDHDTLCVIDDSLPFIKSIFKEIERYDAGFHSEVSCFKSNDYPTRIVYSPVETLTDYHDVRSYQKAARKAICRAIKAGSKRALVLLPTDNRFKNLSLCTILAALEEMYVPIQLREDVPSQKQRLEGTAFMAAPDLIKEALIYESGRTVARDIGVGDPERMTPRSVEQYVKSVLTKLTINVISDVGVLTKEYPLFAAVNRAANNISRHQGRIVFIEYKPTTEIKKTLFLVGKGVTYDTGGADIKAGGVMAGMSRDKCGAAAVAGFMQIVQEMQPKDVHVIGVLCLVRNSVGEDSYVSDEIITSRAGVRVRVGNTDAEGRMCMADALGQMAELAKKCPDPHLYTIATLTGHAIIACGTGYSIAVDNSVARAVGHAQKLSAIGEDVGEPFIVSPIQQDDFDFNKGKALGEDIIQCNSIPSSRTPRGHQVAPAFMMQVTGLDKCGLTSDTPLKYTHLDIAGSAGDVPDMPTGAPIVALAKAHLF